MMLKHASHATRHRIAGVLVGLAAALGVGVFVQGAGAGPAEPVRNVEVIVQLRTGVDPSYATNVVEQAGGTVGRRLPIINGFSAILPAGEAAALTANPSFRAVTPNAAIKTEGRSTPTAIDPALLATSYNAAIRSPGAWARGLTGKGIGIAVVDTGIQGDLPDFRVSQDDPASRVIATAVANPGATTVNDTFGHGTHVAGLIAGNGFNRPAGDPLRGRYAGVAPEANLIAVKASDDAGNATVLDVIDGLQFVSDKGDEYNIRVVNLSLRSTTPESSATDPLDAAVESVWASGIVVVVAAGNDGSADDAVSYAPANDPHVITVGAADEAWSSRGVTQDGFAKPEVLAPGSHLVSTIPADSAYTRQCPTCVVDDQYFRVGGTSMAAAVVSGAVALMLEAYPDYTPDQAKAAIVKRSSAAMVADAERATRNPVHQEANGELTWSTLLEPDGSIDWERASWTRASWTDKGVDALRASWTRASWTRASWTRASWTATPEACADFERASWTRASWTRASWTRASWTRASWTAEGMSSPDLTASDYAAIDAEIDQAKLDCSTLLAQIDPTRASWTRASWTRASWTAGFGK